MKKKEKKMRVVKGTKALENSYKKELNKLGRALILYVKENILPILQTQESSYTLDAGISDILKAKFLEMQKSFSGIAQINFANTVAKNQVELIARQNEKKFNKAIKAATGIEMAGISAGEGLDDFIKLNINKNSELIASLSEEYIKNVQIAVNNGVANGSTYKTIAKEIIGTQKGSISKKLSNRIKLIATNETQTINAQISLRRNSALGITEGIYQTVQDRRVRPSHKELNGVRYELKKGAWSKKAQKYIQPGITDINCRCSYSPIIEV